ncbi:hypothetical protein Gotur_025638 [Gossypium turneri]
MQSWKSRYSKWRKKKMNLRLDADVQKLEAERLRKGKARAEEDLDKRDSKEKFVRESEGKRGARE